MILLRLRRSKRKRLRSSGSRTCFSTPSLKSLRLTQRPRVATSAVFASHFLRLIRHTRRTRFADYQRFYAPAISQCRQHSVAWKSTSAGLGYNPPPKRQQRPSTKCNEKHLPAVSATSASVPRARHRRQILEGGSRERGPLTAAEPQRRARRAGLGPALAGGAGGRGRGAAPGGLLRRRPPEDFRGDGAAGGRQQTRGPGDGHGGVAAVGAR